ncbi:MAG: hypothetical protein AB7G06_09675 [Bdellovibrionales bacterium]
MAAQKQSAYSFSYDFGTDSYVIAALDGSRTIKLPTLRKLGKDTRFNLFMNPVLLKTEDGTEITIKTNSYQKSTVLYHNPAEGWVAQVRPRDEYADLPEREYAPVLDYKPCPQGRGTSVDLERTEIDFLDVKNGLQAEFAGTVVVDDAVIGQYAKVDKKIVAASPLSGLYLDYDFYNASTINKGLAKLHSAFEANLDACTWMRKHEVSIDHSSRKRLYKGNPDKGEPLFTVHAMAKNTYNKDYAKPHHIYELYDLERDEQGKPLVAPIAEKNGSAIYATRGGYIIRPNNFTMWNEELYLITGLPWLLRARGQVRTTRPGDIAADLQVIDINRGMYVRTDGHMTTGIGPSRMKRRMLNGHIRDLPTKRGALGIIRMIDEGMLPLGKEKLYRKGERIGMGIYEPPFKPTRAELREIFNPKHVNR